jgi:phage terminase small subunit
MPRPNSFSAIGLGNSVERIAPPDDLTGAARALFLDLVMACRPAHFQQSDAPLLASYCQAVILEKEAASMIQNNIAAATNTLIKVQQTAHQTMHRLAVRLRISPQSRQPTVSPGTNTKPGNGSYYDKMRLGDS